MLSLCEKLKLGCGMRTIVMLDTYPFFVVGTLNSVSEQYIEVNVEFGVPVELLHLPLRIKLDNIVAVYSETLEGEIPYPHSFATGKEKAGDGINDTAVSNFSDSNTNSV